MNANAILSHPVKFLTTCFFLFFMACILGCVHGVGGGVSNGVGLKCKGGFPVVVALTRHA